MHSGFEVFSRCWAPPRRTCIHISAYYDARAVGAKLSKPLDGERSTLTISMWQSGSDKPCTTNSDCVAEGTKVGGDTMSHLALELFVPENEHAVRVRSTCRYLLPQQLAVRSVHQATCACVEVSDFGATNELHVELALCIST